MIVEYAQFQQSKKTSPLIGNRLHKNILVEVSILQWEAAFQNIFPVPSFRGTDSSRSIRRQLPAIVAIWSILSKSPRRPPVCMKRTFLPSHFFGFSAMSFSRPMAAFPLQESTRCKWYMVLKERKWKNWKSMSELFRNMWKKNNKFRRHCNSNDFVWTIYNECCVNFGHIKSVPNQEGSRTKNGVDSTNRV